MATVVAMASPSVRSGLPRAWPRLAAYAAVACGFTLALHQLGRDSLWSDEIVTARLARHSIDAAWAGIRSDPNHFPLYYLLQWVFSFAGTSEWGIRLPSAFAATATVAAVFWLGRELLDERAGVAAALLLATHPAQIWAAQEARYYALIGVAAALSAAGLLALLRRPGVRPAATFVLGTLAALYTHFFCLVMAAAETVYCSVVLVVGTRRGLKRTTQWLLASGLCIALLSVPAVPYVLRLMRTEEGGSSPMVTKNTFLELWYEYGSLSNTMKYVFLALAVAGLVAMLRSRPKAAALCLLWFVPLPLLTLRQASHFFLAKYVYYLFPMYVALVGVGLAVSARWLGRLAHREMAPLLLLAGLLNVPTLPAYYAAEKYDWRDAAAYLASVAGPEDLVVSLPPAEPEMAWYYRPTAPGAPVAGFGSGQRTIAELVQAAEGVQDVYWIVLLPTGSLPDAAALAPAFDVTTYYGVAVLRSHVPVLEAAATILPQFAAVCGTDGSLAGPAWETAGAILESLDRPEAAREAYAHALAFYAEARVIHRLQGDVARLGGDWALAESEYEAATATSPDLPSVYVRLAQARQATGDGAGAVAAYMAYWRLTGTLPDGLCVREDLLGNLAGTAISAPGTAIDTPYCAGTDAGSCYVAATRFTLPATGEARDALFQHPTSSVTFTLAPVGGDAYLVSAPLVDPQAWGWGGDGVGFRVIATAGSGEQVVGEQVVTPAMQAWQDWVLPLPPSTTALRLETDPGPAGDASGDWAGWAAPLVVTLCDGG